MEVWPLIILQEWVSPQKWGHHWLKSQCDQLWIQLHRESPGFRAWSVATTLGHLLVVFTERICHHFHWPEVDTHFVPIAKPLPFILHQGLSLGLSLPLTLGHNHINKLNLSNSYFYNIKLDHLFFQLCRYVQGNTFWVYIPLKVMAITVNCVT